MDASLSGHFFIKKILSSFDAAFILTDPTGILFFDVVIEMMRSI